MNFLQVIYAKAVAKPENVVEIVPYEKLRSASIQFRMHLANRHKGMKVEAVLKETQQSLNEMILSLETEIRFSHEKRCFQYLIGSKLLDDMVMLCQEDKPSGVLKMVLNFFQQVIEISGDFGKETDNVDILNNDGFVQPLLRLLETSKVFYAQYDVDYIALSNTLCKHLVECVNANPLITDIFIADDLSCPLADSLIKGLHLMDSQKGTNSRNGILNFLKSVRSKKAAKYIFKVSDLALLSSIALGAHFSQLKNTIKVAQYIGHQPSQEAHCQRLSLPKEIRLFLAMINFCQDMLQIAQEVGKNSNCEYSEFKKMFDSYLTDHIKTYFLKNIFTTYISESSEFNISALMYYCSWIIRIVHVSPLKELFLAFFFNESFNGHKKSGYLWRNFSTTSFLPVLGMSGNQSQESIFGLQGSQGNFSRESISSMVFSMQPKPKIPTFFLAQLTSAKQDCLLTSCRLFSNLLCYHPDYAIQELFFNTSTVYFSNEFSSVLFYQNIGRYLSLINSACAGIATTKNFHLLQLETCEKIKSKMISFERDNYEQVNLEKLAQLIEEFQSSDFYLSILATIRCYWKNSFAVNVALIELVQEILTCPVPVIYNAFCNSLTDPLSVNGAESSIFNCLMEIAFQNEFVLNQLSDASTIEIVQQLRLANNRAGNMPREGKGSNEKIKFAYNYILLEEFIKEIVAILQAHALNFYGCLAFEHASQVLSIN